VAKATLYSAFGSKEGLVRAYLRARHAATTERMARELEARYTTPKERLIGVFEVQGLSFTDPDFRGCAFLSANAQAPRHVALNATDVGADCLDGLIEFRLATTGDEDVGTLCDEELRRSQANSGGAPGDDCHLSVQLAHNRSSPDHRKWSAQS
jgi:AcrR family transcriptional regulator